MKKVIIITCFLAFIPNFAQNSVEEENGEKTPITQKVVQPKIEGAIITAKGANDMTTKTTLEQCKTAVTAYLESQKNVKIDDTKKVQSAIKIQNALWRQKIRPA